MIMKKIILFFLLVLLGNAAQAQIIQITTIKPKKIQTKKMVPVTMYTKSDSIITGFGYINMFGYSNVTIRYTKNKPTTQEIRSNEWTDFNSRDLKKLETRYKEEEFTLYPVAVKEAFGLTYLVSEIYKNNAISLYVFPDFKDKMEEAKIGFILKKEGQEKGNQIIMKLGKPSKSLPTRIKKFFSNYPRLQRKIESGIYPKTVDGLKQLLDDYATLAKK